MDNHEETYDDERAERLRGLLRRLAQRIKGWDEAGELLAHVPDLLRGLGEARTELFHYEVRSTYDTPEVAEHRRIVDEARRASQSPDDPEDDEPWRRSNAE